jgi:hypothetical protein
MHFPACLSFIGNGRFATPSGSLGFAFGTALPAPYLPFAVAVVIAGRQTLRLSDFERV